MTDVGTEEDKLKEEERMDDGRERGGKRRSDLVVLTHSDPSPCFSGGIMGIYTLA